MKRYSEKFKKKVLETAARKGLTGVAAAKLFKISPLTFATWRKNAAPQPKPKQKRREFVINVPVTIDIAQIEARVIAEIGRYLGNK